MNVVPALTQKIKRRRWVTIGVLSIFLQVACSHTMVVSPVKEGDRVKLKRAVRGKKVKLETTEKKEKGLVVTLEVTNLKWRPADVMETRTIPLTDVRRMEWRDRKRGFLEGFGIGLGASLSLFIIDRMSKKEGAYEPWPWYGVVGVLSIPVLIGGVIGLAIGSTTVVKVRPNHHEKTDTHAHENGSSHDARD